MFVHYRTKGFILAKIDRGEADQLFTIYTKDFGKLEILGKAIRKISSKLRSGAELFYLSEIEFIQGKIYKTLTDVVLTDSFKGLRGGLGRLSLAFRTSEVLDGLVKGQEPDEKIWQLLNATFEKLSDCSLSAVHYSLAYYYFLWNLLSVLGYRPELYHCSSCQKEISPEKIFFNPREGGLICHRCEKLIRPGKPIDPDAIKIIRIILKQDWPTLKKLKFETKNLKQLKTISRHYLSEILEQTRRFDRIN